MTFRFFLRLTPQSSSLQRPRGATTHYRDLRVPCSRSLFPQHFTPRIHCSLFLFPQEFGEHQTLVRVRLLAWTDVVGHGGSPPSRRWRGQEIHVDQHQGKDGRQISLLIKQGNPERPAAPRHGL